MKAARATSLAALLCTLLGVATANAAPLRLAVVPVEDTTGELSPALTARLTELLLNATTELGEIDALATNGPRGALRALTEGVLVARIDEGDGERIFVVVSLFDRDGAAEVVRREVLVDATVGDALDQPLQDALLAAVDALFEGPDALPRRTTPRPTYVPPPLVVPEPPPPPEPEPEPSGDAFVIDAGLRPEAGRFAGLTQVGLVSAWSDAFVGVMQLGGAEARADDFVGALQLGFLSADAQVFRGAFQVGLRDTYAGDFVGGLQLALGVSDSARFTGLGQLALGYSHAARFRGLVQLAVVSNVDLGDGDGDIEPAFLGLAQIGAIAASERFEGGFQLGLVSQAGSGGFEGLFQVAAYASAERDFDGVAQVGLFASTERTFSGVIQAGALAYVGNNLYREIFGASIDNGDNASEDFQGVLQVGLATLTDDDFRGVFSVAALGSGTGGGFFGAAQVAPLNYVEDDFQGGMQVGLANLVSESFYGFSQLGLLNVSGSDVTGAQVGVVNLVDHDVRGVQVGLLSSAQQLRGIQVGVVNYVDVLRGLQLGLVNLAGSGGLPVTVLANAGF